MGGSLIRQELSVRLDEVLFSRWGNGPLPILGEVRRLCQSRLWAPNEDTVPLLLVASVGYQGNLA